MKRGFTLVETLFAVTLSILLIGAIVLFGKNILGLNRSASQSLTAEFEGERALRLMTIELRETLKSASGAYPLESAASSSIAFYADTNNDGTPERIYYYLDPAAKALKRSASSETVLASNLLPTSTPIFSFFDKNGASTASLTDIRLVSISLTVGDHSLTTSVELRNLKDNP